MSNFTTAIEIAKKSTISMLIWHGLDMKSYTIWFTLDRKRELMNLLKKLYFFFFFLCCNMAIEKKKHTLFKLSI